MGLFLVLNITLTVLLQLCGKSNIRGRLWITAPYIAWLLAISQLIVQLIFTEDVKPRYINTYPFIQCFNIHFLSFPFIRRCDHSFLSVPPGIPFWINLKAFDFVPNTTTVIPGLRFQMKCSLVIEYVIMGI